MWACPLDVVLSRHFDVLGININVPRVETLNKGHDSNSLPAMHRTGQARSYHCGRALASRQPLPPRPCPCDGCKPHGGASHAYGCVVCYESTVNPGVTENDCIPLQVKESGKNFSTDFNVGYSPERINP